MYLRRGCSPRTVECKWKSNDQESIQSNTTSCAYNQDNKLEKDTVTKGGIKYNTAQEDSQEGSSVSVKQPAHEIMVLIT